jgi:hypothetical protein
MLSTFQGLFTVTSTNFLSFFPSIMQYLPLWVIGEPARVKQRKEIFGYFKVCLWGSTQFNYFSYFTDIIIVEKRRNDIFDYPKTCNFLGVHFMNTYLYFTFIMTLETHRGASRIYGSDRTEKPYRRISTGEFETGFDRTQRFSFYW